MVSFSLIFNFALAGIASAASAPITNNSPKGVSYVATFNTANATGTFTFSVKDKEVWVNVQIPNYPITGGPFLYYIHESSIPANGTCADAKGIFNPYNGSYPTGNMSIPVSDVALGNFPTNNGFVGDGMGTYILMDNDYWSLNPNDKAYIGNLSVVFQYVNKTPIACGNIVKSSTQSPKSGASKMAGIAAALPLAAGAAALLI